MSKIGNKEINLPDGVEVIQRGMDVVVKGPKGEMFRALPRNIELRVEGNKVNLIAKNNTKETRSLHGTYRAHVANMVTGVLEGWKKQLELVGTGYKAELKGDTLVVHVGFSHPVEFKVPDGIKFSVEKTTITIEGIDKELVGLTSARIRKTRPPEPYKGKGIRYIDEEVRRKAGKAAKAVA